MRNFIRQLIRANRPDVIVKINPQEGNGVIKTGGEEYPVQYDAETGDCIVGGTLKFTGSNAVSEAVQYMRKPDEKQR
jgi:hypothetical protein